MPILDYYYFNELTLESKIKAVTDYCNGWRETHEEDLDRMEVASFLEDDMDSIYNPDGFYMGQLTID